MSGQIDPYASWLQLSVSGRTPNLYELLGLPNFETDEERIQEAYRQRHALVRRYEVGRHEDQAQALLEELSAAYHRLTNAVEKKDYDEQLRGQMADRATAYETDTLVDRPLPADAQPSEPHFSTPGEIAAGTTGDRRQPRRPPPLPGKPLAACGTLPSQEAVGRKAVPAWLFTLLALTAIGVPAAILVCLLVVSDRSEPLTAAAGPSGPGNTALPNRGQHGSTGPSEALENPPLEVEGAASNGLGMGPADGQAPPPSASSSDQPLPPNRAEQDQEDANPFADGAAVSEDELDKVAVPESGPKPSTKPPGPQPPDTQIPDRPPPETLANVPVTPHKTPKRPPYQPPKEPFEDLPTAVGLPELDPAASMQLASFGAIHIAPNASCSIELLGGDQACAQDERFALRPTAGGRTGLQQWAVSLLDSASGAETEIARLAITDASELSFQWLPEAKTRRWSQYLANCALSLRCGRDHHITALREPDCVPAMNIDLSKTSRTRRWPVDTPPSDSVIRVQFRSVEGHRHTVEPASTIDADGGQAWIQLTDMGDLLALHVETLWDDSFRITVTPYLLFPNNAGRQKLNGRTLLNYEKKVRFELKRCQMAMQQTQATAQRFGNGAAVAGQLQMIRQQADKWQKKLGTIADLERMMKSTRDDLEMNFRVFFAADSTSIDLLRIGD